MILNQQKPGSNFGPAGYNDIGIPGGTNTYSITDFSTFFIFRWIMQGRQRYSRRGTLSLHPKDKDLHKDRDGLMERVLPVKDKLVIMSVFHESLESECK